MNAFNLLLPDGSPSKVWVCGECRLTSNDQARAERCCSLIPCRFCGEPTDRKFRHDFDTADHPACAHSNRAKRDMERMERAEKLEAWDGWVWHDGHGGNNGYFEDVDVYVEHLEDEGLAPEDWPEWVYVADTRHPRIDVQSVLENVIEDGWEDMGEEDLNGVKELDEAIKAFNKANETVNVYDANMKRVVRVPRPDQKGD